MCFYSTRKICKFETKGSHLRLFSFSSDFNFATDSIYTDIDACTLDIFSLKWVESKLFERTPNGRTMQTEKNNHVITFALYTYRWDKNKI